MQYQTQNCCNEMFYVQLLVLFHRNKNNLRTRFSHYMPELAPVEISAQESASD